MPEYNSNYLKTKLANYCFLDPKNPKSLLILCLALACLSLTCACSSLNLKNKKSAAQVQKTDIIDIHYQVANKLLQAIQDEEVFENPLLITNFVYLQNLEQSSPLGRAIPQQIGARLTQLGLKLVDIRLRTNSILVRTKDGEFGLSRKLEEINRGIQGYAILVGTYSVLYGKIFVNARILRSSDALILASVDYTLPLTPQAFPPGQFPENAKEIIKPTVKTKL